MTRLKLHDERHRVTRVGWLRAAVLGANDGIVSTASLIVGVAAASADRSEVLVAGVAGLVAGAMSMAAGEYVSVSSQSDTESADLTRERGELATQPDAELEELASLYRSRGLDAETARKTAEQLMAHDALGAHARDELGISEVTAARPIQAAFTSAATFTAGAIWNVDSFDQWGVELGKKACSSLLPILNGPDAAAPDSSTDGLVKRYRNWRGR